MAATARKVHRLRTAPSEGRRLLRPTGVGQSCCGRPEHYPEGKHSAAYSEYILRLEGASTQENYLPHWVVIKGERVTPEIAFGQVVQELRRANRLSQEKLAELSDTHRTYVSLIERGKFSPSLSVIFRLAEPLGLTPSELLAHVESKIRSVKEA